MEISSSTSFPTVWPRSIRAIAVIGAVAILGLANSVQAQLPPPPGETFEVVSIAQGLSNPWSVTFLPNGDMLVSERGGQLRIIRDGNLLADPVPGVPAVRAVGQGGLHDVVLHPDFESNRMIYLSYAKGNEDNSLGTTALARARFEDDRLVDVEEIFEADAWSDTPGHFGARIAFGPEGICSCRSVTGWPGFPKVAWTRTLRVILRRTTEIIRER